MTPLWQPTDDQIDTSQMADFVRFVSREPAPHNPSSYQSLYDWSIDDPAAFWSSVWDYSGVIGERGSDRVVTNGEQMPGASWFPDAKLNFAENLLRRRDDGIALVGLLDFEFFFLLGQFFEVNPFSSRILLKKIVEAFGGPGEWDPGVVGGV